MKHTCLCLWKHKYNKVCEPCNLQDRNGAWDVPFPYRPQFPEGNAEVLTYLVCDKRYSSLEQVELENIVQRVV